MATRSRPRVVAETTSSCALDLVALTGAARGLTVLLVESPARRSAWQLPAAVWHDGTDLSAAIGRLSTFVLGVEPQWIDQVGAFSGGAHPLGPSLSVAAVTVVPRGTETGGSAAWHPVTKLPASVPARQRAIIDAAVAHARRSLDRAPIAFHLLPEAFTLTELQEVYELLLGRVLHKASFRRALLAADVVQATDEWRSEGRGRPAQLFSYDARRRRRAARAMRFDFD